MRKGQVNLWLILVMVLCFTAPAGAGADVGPKISQGISVLVQGKEINFHWPLATEGSDVLVPAPDLAQATGAVFKLYPGNGKIEFTRQSRTVSLAVDSPRMSINGSISAITRPRSVEGVVYLPLQPLISGLGGKVERSGHSVKIYFDRITLVSPPSSSSGVEAVEELIPEGSRVAPPVPLMPGDVVIPAAIQKGDFNGDGADEHVVSYKTGDGRAGVVVYREKDKLYQKLWQKEENYPLSDVVVADLNSGGSELLIGWLVGASTGASLQVYTWQGDSFRLLHSDYYHRLEVGDFDGDGSGEYAAWAKDTGTSFAVTVNDWDGQKFTPKENCSAYFARVVRYYQEQIKILPPARFLVYYLADAHLRAGDAGLALEQAGRGLSMPYGYPSHHYFYRIKGEALQKQGKYKEAVDAYKLALEGGMPGTLWSRARYGLAVGYKNMGEDKLALAEITRALNEGNDWAGYAGALEILKKWQGENIADN